MKKEFWKFPQPVTSLLGDPEFSILSRRRCKISLKFEDKEGEISETQLIFHDVESFRCTYGSSINAEIINASYGKVINLDDDSWFHEIRSQSTAHYLGIKKEPPNLVHMAIYFDDGPYFEFICARLEAI